jgi:Uma2 family endonuclease
MAIQKALMTADDLWQLPDDGQRHELVRGELRTIALRGEEHAWLMVNLGVPLSVYVDARGLGRVYTEVGFRLESEPDTVRAPDVAFIRQERL